MVGRHILLLNTCLLIQYRCFLHGPVLPCFLIVHCLCIVLPHNENIKHVYIWSLTLDKPVLTTQAVLSDGAGHDRALKGLDAVLADDFGVYYVTIQLERKRLDQAGQH